MHGQSLVDQQLADPTSPGGHSGADRDYSSYFSLPSEGATRYSADMSTKGAYWRLTRQPGELLPEEAGDISLSRHGSAETVTRGQHPPPRAL